eukprot:jgi/Chrpa1/6482/Chrysochromulina_OHIO_Genome00001437-RA
MGNVNKKPVPPPAGPVLVSGNMQMFGFPAWIVMLGVYAGLHMLSYAVVVSGAFGRDSSLSKNPHLAAHFLPQLFGFAILAYLGGGGWLHADMPSIDPGPGAYISFGEQIAMHMLSFQLYEIAACIPAPRLRGKFNELIGHHIITLVLSYLAYKHQAYHYWAPCFMGMPEISSVPLAVMDHLKNFKPLAQRFPNLNEASQVIFSLLFLPIRGVYWPYSSVWFWKMSLATLSAGSVLPATWVIYIFCVANVLMTALQWYWSSLILKGLYAKMTGAKSPVDDEVERKQAKKI